MMHGSGKYGQWLAMIVLIVGIAVFGTLSLAGVTFAGSKPSHAPPPIELQQISRDPSLSFALGYVDVLPGTMAEVPVLITPNTNMVTKIVFTLQYAEYLIFEGVIEDKQFLSGSTHQYQHNAQERTITIEISGTMQVPLIAVNVPLVAVDKSLLPEPVPQQNVRLERIAITVQGQATPVTGRVQTIPYVIQTRLDLHINGMNDQLLDNPEKILLGATSVLSMPLGWKGYDKIKWDIYGDGSPDGVFYTNEPECATCLYRRTSTIANPFHPIVSVLDGQGNTILSGTLIAGVFVYVPPMNIVSKEPTFLGQETTLQIQVGEAATEFLDLIQQVQWSFGDGQTANSALLETSHLYRATNDNYQPTARFTLKNGYTWDGNVSASPPIIVRAPVLIFTNSSLDVSGPTDPNLPYPHNTTFFTITVEGLFLTDATIELDFGDGSTVRISFPSNPNGVVQKVSRSHRYSKTGIYESKIRLFSPSFGGNNSIAESSSLATVTYRPLSLQATVDKQTIAANGKSSIQVRVTVYNTNHQPMEDMTIVFQANPSRGTFLPASQVNTNAAGIAEVQFLSERIVDWGETSSLPINIIATLDGMGVHLESTRQITLVPFQQLFIPRILVQDRFNP